MELDRALKELDAWIAEAAPEVHAAHRTASDDDLAALEALGPATAELIALYRVLGGTSDWQGFWRGLELVDAKSAIQGRASMNGLDDEQTWYRWMPNEWWSPRWLPFLDNHSYDLVCIDLDSGAVVQWSKDGPSRPILAPSLGQWLSYLLTLRDHGLATWDPSAGIQTEPGRDAEIRQLREQVMPGYPIEREARRRVDVEGTEPPPKPPVFVKSSPDVPYAIARQWWAPGSAPVRSLAWVPHEQRLAVAQSDPNRAPGTLCLVDPQTGLHQVALDFDRGRAGDLVQVGSATVMRLEQMGSIRIAIWEGEHATTLGPTKTAGARSISVGGEWIAIGSNPLRLWNLVSKQLDELDVEVDRVVVGLSPDDRILAIAEPDAPLWWVDLETGEEVAQLGETLIVTRIVFGVDQDLWVLTNRAALRFDVASGAPRPCADVHAPFVAAIHRPSGRIALAGYSGTVQVLDAKSGEQLARDKTHNSRVYGLAWDETGSRLWSGGDDGQLVERLLS